MGDAYLSALQLLFQPVNLIILVSFVIVGIMVGLIPVISASLVIPLLLPFIFRMTPDTALIMLVALTSSVFTSGGITSILFYHIFINIGMAVGIMPVTGLPLCFMSYGGSNLLMCMISIGILINIRMRKFVH